MARHRYDDEDRRDDRRGRSRDRDDWDDRPRSGRRRDEPRRSPAANVVVLAVAGFVGVLAFVGAGLLVREVLKPKAPAVPPPGLEPGPGWAGGGPKADGRGPVWAPNVYLALHPHLYKYALAHGSKLPGSAADLGAFKQERPDLFAHLESGEVVVFWGQNANRRYWAHPKGAEEKGGHLLRFDGQPEVVDAAGFRTGKDAPFTPAPSPVPGRFRRDYDSFFGMTWMHKLLALYAEGTGGKTPPSFDEFPKFHEGIREHDEFFRAVDEGKIVVRWGRAFHSGLVAYEKDFPTAGGWCVIDGAMRKVTRERAAQYLQER